MNTFIIIVISIIFIILIINSISFRYDKTFYVIKNRSELDKFSKYSKLQTELKINNGEIQPGSYSRYYCEYWCNPEYKNGEYILNNEKRKEYTGNLPKYGIDIHGNDFPIIIPIGVTDKKKIHFDFNNFLNFIPDILKSIKS